MGFDELFEDFNKCARSSEDYLKEILAMIEAHRVPDAGQREKLDCVVEELSRKYDIMCKAAEDMLLPEELPPKGSPAESFDQAVRNSKKAAFEKLAADVRTVLEQFISVQSLVANLASALKPFQDEADDLLKRMRTGQIQDMGEVQEKASGPKLFVKALSFENTDGNEEFDTILDELEEKFKYPSRITRGLYKKEYFLPGNKHTEERPVSAPAAEAVKEPEKEEEKTVDNPVLESTPDANGYTEAETEKTKTEKTKTEKTKTEKTKTAKETGKPADSDFVAALKKHEIAKPLRTYGILSPDISTNETKKISSKDFTNDMRKGSSFKALKYALDCLLTNDIISTDLLLVSTGMTMPVSVAENTLDFLHKKGYLRKYRLMPGGEFYTGTDRLKKGLSFKDAAKFLDIKQRKGEEETPIEDRASSAAVRIAFLNTYRNTVLSYQALGADRQTLSGTFFTEMFVRKIVDPDSAENGTELLAGSFLTEYNECDQLIARMKQFISDDEKLSRFVFGASDLETGRIFVEELRKAGPKPLSDVETVLYVLNDDSYHSLDGKEMAVEEVWPALKEEDGESGEAPAQTETSGAAEEVTEAAEGKETKGTETCEKGSEEELPAEPDNVQKVNNEVKPVKPAKTEKTAATVTDEDILYSFFIRKKYYCAPPYAKALSVKNEAWKKQYDLIAYALNDPMRHCVYKADNIFDLVPEERTPFSDALLIATGIRAFFSNQIKYDYSIRSLHSTLNDSEILGKYSALSNVLYKLYEFKNETKAGMDAYADYKQKNVTKLEEELKHVQGQAGSFYDNFIIGKKSEKASQKRFLETKRMLYSPNGDIGQFIKCVKDNSKDMQPLMVDFLQENFIGEGNTLEEGNIDQDMLWDYITKFWDEAGDKMFYKIRADLKSRLRTNIITSSTKSLQIMVHWCNLIDRFKDQTGDAGMLAYRKIRTPLLADIGEALDAVRKDIENRQLPAEERAGLEAIRFTLDEVRKCIEGSYEEYAKRYFYVPFLFTDDILLDDSYCPDLDVRSSDVWELQPEYRIRQHSEKKLPSVEGRFAELMEDKGDDYGTVRLLVDYLGETEPEMNLDEVNNNYDLSERKAKESAELKKGQFIGELELAQSYGQIDNADSLEAKKEKILQIIEIWYEYAVESSNYGFFARVMDSYLTEIRREAKSREKRFLDELETARNMSLTGITLEQKAKKIEKIKAAIDQQNYTVAEDLLGRMNVPDDDIEDVYGENFLKDFLDDYNEYYRIVATQSAKFSTLAVNKIRNKEDRGGRIIAENWLTTGADLGKDRLVKLLNGLGFNVAFGSVQEEPRIGRLESYFVKTTPARYGRRENYTHPIAAFGSAASQEGFRVVCLRGRYDAENLIAVMKQIGKAKNTMILLDYALDKPERRILARKSKTELSGDKLFVVIDRTVMMYLVRNYDGTKINRMLMSLVVPFGYYQPYVWDSASFMPPEIFMGRKFELESIEAANGANIVYGGRQLGKSALLKKAKEDIDRNENGDRAVLIDIKGLDYKDTAKKIGHALHDEGILAEDITTTDWAELSRVISNRLKSDKDRIPYLLLLLDEADAFIESSAPVNYKPFDALKDIQKTGEGRFKFVIAGLRNIVRAKRQALSFNSVLTHFNTMTVTPFKMAEARELMEIPLHYLGFEFPKEKESLLISILANTNYFPGLIQMYCAKLLQAMRKDYAGYDEADTPIYEITEDHIKKVLADPDFMKQIREKFIITLRLDEDNYYYIIALIMAYLYHRNGYNEGYSAQDIKQAGSELGINKIAALEDDKLYAFMEELRELNVLRSADEQHYLFTRFSFFQMMGTSSEVEDQLVNYMEV